MAVLAARDPFNQLSPPPDRSRDHPTAPRTAARVSPPTSFLVGLFWLLWVGGQAILRMHNAVIVPEGLEELVQIGDQGQADVQVHLQVLQPLLQLGEGRPGCKGGRRPFRNNIMSAIYAISGFYNPRPMAACRPQLKTISAETWTQELFAYI